VLKFIDNIPVIPLLIVAIFMALAPFVPEPHLVEKIRMLSQGELRKAIDIFDLLWHSFPIILLVIRLMRMKKLAEDDDQK